MSLKRFSPTHWIRAISLQLALLCLIAGSHQAIAAENASPGPTVLVQHSVSMVVGIVKDRSLTPAQRREKLQEQIRRLVDTRFDFRSMSQSVMATHWQQASAYERDRFVDFFAQSLEAAYMDVIESYDDEKIQFVGEHINGDRATVDTEIVAGNKVIPVSYRMKKNGNDWHTYDVVIEGSSLVSNYRNLYAQIINSSGVSGLLDEMEDNLSVARNRKTTPGGLDLTLSE